MTCRTKRNGIGLAGIITLRYISINQLAWAKIKKTAKADLATLFPKLLRLSQVNCPILRKSSARSFSVLINI